MCRNQRTQGSREYISSWCWDSAPQGGLCHQILILLPSWVARPRSLWLCAYSNTGPALGRPFGAAAQLPHVREQTFPYPQGNSSSRQFGTFVPLGSKEFRIGLPILLFFESYGCSPSMNLLHIDTDHYHIQLWVVTSVCQELSRVFPRDISQPCGWDALARGKISTLMHAKYVLDLWGIRMRTRPWAYESDCGLDLSVSYF